MASPHAIPSITLSRTHAATRRTRHWRMLTCLLGAVCLASSASRAGAATKTSKSTAKRTTKATAVTTKAPVKPPSANAKSTAPVTTAAAAAVGSPIPKKGGTVHLGYFPNVTHAPAIAGVEGGFFAKALGPGVKLQTSAFSAGPAAIEALLSGAIDATYIGPNPAINGFVRSNGKALRIVAGSTSGGAFLVVKPQIRTADDLKGKKIATPQLGGTQDVALRYWLKTKGLSTTLEGGGDVSVVPQENSQTLETFRSGAIDGAWVPEPWATRLILEGGAKVLVDERDLWPKQSFTTTILIARTEFLAERPDLVEALLAGQVATIHYLQQNPAKAQDLVNRGIEKLTGRKLTPATISNSWVNLTFTNDPELASMATAADHAAAVGLLKKVSLKGIEDLTLLNKVLAVTGRSAVTG